MIAATAVMALSKNTDVPNDSNRLKIGVFIYRGDDTFISNMMNSLNEIVSQFGNDMGEHVYLSIVDAQGSQTTQNGQIKRYLSLGYDVLCVNLVDRTSAMYIIDKAMEANVPVVFFNREPVQADMQKWDKLYYIGTDARLNGDLEGQIIVDAYTADPKSFDKNGDDILQYIMIEGEFRHQDAVIRTERSVQTLIDAGISVEKLDGGIANWERSQASALVKDYFEKYGEQIELIICNNDDMALGVVDIVEDMGLDFYNIVGIDGTPQGLKAIEEGKMLGTVVIDFEAQANLIFNVAYALSNNRDPRSAVPDMQEDRIIRAPMYIVTKQK